MIGIGSSGLFLSLAFKRASSKKSFFTLITSQSIHSWRQTAILRKAKCPTGSKNLRSWVAFELRSRNSPKGASPPRLRHEWIASFYRFLYFLDEAHLLAVTPLGSHKVLVNSHSQRIFSVFLRFYSRLLSKTKAINSARWLAVPYEGHRRERSKRA